MPQTLTSALAETHHLLVLPPGAATEDIAILASTRWRRVEQAMGEVTLSRYSSLFGPYIVGAGLGPSLGLPRGLNQAWLATTLTERGDRPFPGSLDPTGVARAFPDGLPVREERRVIDFLVATARRLGGVARFHGSGLMVAPVPDGALDLSVYSPLWLEPEAALATARSVVPHFELAIEWHDFAPVGALDDAADELSSLGGSSSGVGLGGGSGAGSPGGHGAGPGGAGLGGGGLGGGPAAGPGGGPGGGPAAGRGSSGGGPAGGSASGPVAGSAAAAFARYMPDERRAELHQRARERDRAVAAEPPALDRYALSADLGPAGTLVIEIAGVDEPPGALRQVDWASSGAVAYTVRWIPVDPKHLLMEFPPPDHCRTRSQMANLIASLARVIQRTVGGEVLDADAFPIHPTDL